MSTASPRPELLAPGGSLEKCRIAFLYGADAVYVGGKNHSLRAYARNLSGEEIAHACALAHAWGRRVYVTINSFAREKDLPGLPAHIEYLSQIPVDGLIVSDPGILDLARRIAPQVPIHLSTQVNTTNSLSARFWQGQGTRRINLARELSLEELIQIRRNFSGEIEIFVHGAMCVSYSGRCLLSALLTGRGANNGLCTQPCRWSYHLVEEKRPGEYFPLHEDSQGSYILSSKDLCLIEEIDTLTRIGIDAFKIEGRMKGALYLASTVNAYRRAIDRCTASPGGCPSLQDCVNDLEAVSHRPYTKGFLIPGSTPLAHEIAPTTRYVQSHTLAGIVRPSPHSRWESTFSPAEPLADPLACIEARSRLLPGMTLHFLAPDGSVSQHVLDHFEDLNGRKLRVAHPNAWILVPLPFPVLPYQVVRICT